MTTENQLPDQCAPPTGFEPADFNYGFVSMVGPMFIDRSRFEHPSLGFRVLEKHINPAQICHGGMLMTAWDMAVTIAVGSTLQQMTFLPSANLSHDFIAPAKLGDWVESKIDFVHTTKRTGFASGFLNGPNGPIMRASGITKITQANDERFQIDPEIRDAMQKNRSG